MAQYHGIINSTACYYDEDDETNFSILAGVYIMQNTMVGGGGGVWGEK